MKKRKAPILLLSLLVVLIGGAVVFGMSSNGGDQKPQSDQPDELTKQHDAPSPSEVKDQIAKSATQAKMPPKLAAAEAAMKGPTIAVPQNEIRYKKPVPDGPTTSSQWYSNK